MTGDVDGLARRAASGDGDAFATLCRRLNDEVWRYCSALTADRELAFEAAQETFLRLVTAIRRYRGDGPVRTFVFTIARRSVAARIRSQVRHRAAPVETAPEPAVADHAGATDTWLLLQDLDSDQRQAFVLTQVVGMSYEEAARVCGCRVGTIRSRVFRSRERLVQLLGAVEQQDPGRATDA
jgi:RNA polymerase sigma-70 factor (ECF subfamily)